MTRSVTVTWELTQEEHKYWLAQAREVHLTVAEYIYTLAVAHAEEHGLPEDAVRDTILRIAAAQQRRSEAQRR